jgi:hypothetical protein
VYPNSYVLPSALLPVEGVSTRYLKNGFCRIGITVNQVEVMRKEKIVVLICVHSD